ncbi:MAG TPA: DUF2279 domain-containing protein [Ferruginibacter sp.]|nr:DUF2279 domain-containing protein [Ferruginibacter sp.]
MSQATVHRSTSLASHPCTRIILLSFFTCTLFSFSSFSQDTISKPGFVKADFIKDHGDSILYTNKTISRSTNKRINGLTNKQINTRVKIIAATNLVGYSGAMVGLYSAWYKNYPQSNFHSFNDFPEWKQIDKIGHAYSAYAESKASMELWRWTGIDRKKRIWIGGMSGAFYQTVIEVLDAYSAEWGWSWSDFGANLLGSGMLVAQELAWDEQRIQFKFSFHRKSYNDASLNQRSDKIFGKTTAERFLKDYNGQTYWLSVNLRSFFPKSKLPAWLNISIGTGAEGMFGANENIGKDDNGNINFYRPDIKRYRQWYLAPDIDLTKIKTNKKGLKLVFTLLNIIKFPMPALEYSNGKFRFNAIGF